MPIRKESHYITDAARKRFKLWLFKNDLSFNQFAKRCGVSRQLLDRVIKGNRPVTHTIREHFKKGGYELL